MAKKPQTPVTAKSTNYGANRLKRLLKHLKKHPNDINATEALETNKTVSTRKASNNKLGWMSSNKEVDTYVRSKFVGSITKHTAIAHANILKFTKVAPYHLLAVLTKTEEGIGYALKHTSKFSNFKGKGKGKTKAEETTLTA